MGEFANHNRINSNDVKNEEKGNSRVFNGREIYHTSIPRALIALSLWIGSIHFILFLLFISYILFSPPTSAMVIGFQVILMVLPLDENSKFGLRIFSYVSKYVMGHFPVTLYVEDMKCFQSNRAYVFGFHPHSVFPLGVAILCEHLAVIPIPNIKFLTSNPIFRTPVLRQIWSWCGAIAASKKNFTAYLSAGYTCVVIPGGVQEILHMRQGAESDNVFISRRKGFIKVAIQTVTPLVPVFFFGQAHTYKWWRPKCEFYVLKARAIRFGPTVFWGRLGSHLPCKNPTVVVVGRPITVEKTLKPTIDEISKFQREYTVSLRNLFDKYKTEIGHPGLELKIL
uniref:Acyltransferase n=1 Tax=Vernonia galamensis TaxID=83960 RepID=D6BNB1_VERGA|nr:type 2 acyl-CoA diacylglycerol acyltransferase [Vernonia galamensis]